ncbi:MAG: hypothetical protein QNJ44_05535 [Rhodobacter sp.]|nr:hypothetical protein [Rhodobacter sp.]
MLLDPIFPFLGAGGRRWATRLVNPRGKLFIPPQLGVEGFFRALEDAGARHVVLRWFDELPHIARGHDLDILVADEAVGTVDALLSTWPRGQKIDYYSETGTGGTGYRPELLHDVPAFPASVARELLASAQRRPGGWSVPGPRGHFLGLAYHAVYLKGFASGLAADDFAPPRKKGSRDYAAVLSALGETAGIPIAQPVTMASLDAMLRIEGWRPDDAHLAALAPANRWIGAAA